MARRGYEDDEAEEDELEEEEQGDDAYQEDEVDEEEEEEEYDDRTSRRKSVGKGGKGSSSGGKKRARSDFIDDTAIEDDDEEEEDDDDDEDYGGGRGGGGGRKKKPRGSQFLDLEATVDSDDEEEEEDEGEDGFIVENEADIREETGNRRERRPFIGEEHEEDVEEMERQVKERYFAYSRPSQMEYADDATDVEQQALLPSVKDPKLWMVKCQIGQERETAIRLMQKHIDRGDLSIRSVIALDHLKNYIYVEAEKEAHVKEACNGLRNIFSSAKIMLVPIKEMTDVLSVESKSVDLTRDTWVRMKIGVYKGDLAKVVDVDNVRQRVTVKLIPRVDLQMLANKLEGREVPKKKAFLPPPRFFNVEEAREMRIRVERRFDKDSREYYEMVDGLMFKDGFLYKTVSMKSIYSNNIHPSFDELEKFRKPGDDGNGDVSTLFTSRKKGHFMKGDAVVVVRGDLKNLEGWVEKVEEDIVHIKPKDETLGKTLAFKEKELCKHFKLGDHVKVVSGKQEGSTGMVVKVDGHVLTILSDVLKKHIDVFADDVVESSEITTGVTRIGDYELHDLVLLDNMSFGVIVRVESEAFQVLKGVPDRPEVVLVKLREIKSKLDRRTNAKDRSNNLISSKDIVRVIEGPLKGKQGPVEHIYKGILFIHDRHHLEHAGFICAKSLSCLLVGGSNSNRSSNDLDSRYGALRSSSNVFQSPARLPPRGPPRDFGGGGGRFGGGRGVGGRGHGNELVGKCVRIKAGPFKGYRGRVTEVKGSTVRVELDSQMKNVTVNRDQIADTNTTATPFREPRYSLGGETPMHPSRTPLHPIQTPMRDPSATPIHDGMRTPMHSRAWHPMSPPRDNWDDADPGSWGSSPTYHPGTPPARPYEAPTPGSGWANTPGGNFNDPATPSNNSYGNAPSPYVPSTPVGQPMTPSSAAYLPGTPGGQPMTPGNLDAMSPMAGGEGEPVFLVPDVLVNVDSQIAVVREILPDGSYKIALGSSGNGDVVTVSPAEVEVVRPKKSDKIKVLCGSERGTTGRLIGVDGSEGIVKLDGSSYGVKILDVSALAKSI
ncbi:hypothetical protein LUZ60_001321 [Juncus effusus]|nr:hypothetical protein LUZ60_001321 [Juncus effusus]